MNAIQVLSPGLFSSIQDAGRKGYRKYGVPVSGVMDSYCAGVANMLLNNPVNTPLIEITLQGPTLQFNCNTAISIVGADMSARINDQPVRLNSVIRIETNDTLSFGKLISGCRCYIAVAGGLEPEKILGSHSYYQGIADNNRLTSSTVLRINELGHHSPNHAGIKLDADHFSSSIVDAQRGPEFEMLSEAQKKLIVDNHFIVGTKNNRMGYQLEGLSDHFKNDFSILTSTTIPGTVQLTPAGNPIVLMRDCQTTGGYPRILQLTENGINRIAQKKTKDSIRFQLT